MIAQAPNIKDLPYEFIGIAVVLYFVWKCFDKLVNSFSGYLERIASSMESMSSKTAVIENKVDALGLDNQHILKAVENMNETLLHRPPGPELQPKQE